MGILVYLWLLGAAAVGQPQEETPVLRRFDATQPQMGGRFTILLYAEDQETANRAFAAAFSRIEALDRVMSDYDGESEVSRLSRASPTEGWVPVSDDLWAVLSAAQTLARRTEGAFDVTVGPLSKLWRRARRQRKMPSAERLAEARSAVGYRYLQLDPRHKAVKLLRPNMRLDLGGIAKGYAAQEALAELRRCGVARALVNGGGDIALGDPPPGKKGWKIGIAPLQADARPSRFLVLSNRAIATSGDAWQYVEIGGRRYSHIIDPKTGLGLTTRSSVTVVAPDGAQADGLASAVSVLGPEKGLKLIEETCGTAALIVQVCGGRVKTQASKRFGELSPQRK